VWDKVRDVFAGKILMGDDASRDELMAYQYLLHQQKRELIKMKRDLEARKEAANASSLRRIQLSSTGGASAEGRRWQ
jgi:hypothetical protein